MNGAGVGRSAAARIALTCHPRTPAGAVRAIHADVSRDVGRLRLTFLLVGDLDQLRVPPPGPARLGRDLWRHTCFEAFVGVVGATGYHELNLAPSAEWRVYAFDRYREGAAADAVRAPRVVVGAGYDELELDALVDLSTLSPTYATAPLRLALATVVEETSGALSYWALRHPPGAPDFHHPDAFVLRLEPAGGAC